MPLYNSLVFLNSLLVSISSILVFRFFFVPKISASFTSYIIYIIYIALGGPGSSVGTATDYGLDGPGSKPGGDEVFRPSRSALGPT